MVETGDAHLTYSLEHKKHGEMNTCIQRATAEGLTQTVVYMSTLGRDGQTYNGKKKGSKQGGGGAVKRATPHPRSPCQNCRP